MNTNAIYPGSFQPPIPWRNGNHREYNTAIAPAYSVSRESDMIIFRCWIPGIRRDDIQLVLRNHRVHLSVCTSPAAPLTSKYETIRYHLDRMLPRDADTTWFSAEYRRGVLTIRFSITNDPQENGIMQVVVY